MKEFKGVNLMTLTFEEELTILRRLLGTILDYVDFERLIIEGSQVRINEIYKKRIKNVSKEELNDIGQLAEDILTFADYNIEDHLEDWELGLLLAINDILMD